SDDKGPEPEAATIGHKDGRIYAFIGLERTGGFVIYDVTNPVSPDFIDYIYTKGDIGPEGIEFIPEDAYGNSLIVVGNEVSGSISVYRMR
ncbi:MAG: choice-of-anchor I domain-containing protein, partial [Dehalococcoidia bacterium]